MSLLRAKESTLSRRRNSECGEYTREQEQQDSFYPGELGGRGKHSRYPCGGMGTFWASAL